MVVGVVCEREAGQLQHRHVQNGTRREKRRVGQPALDDDLDVAETIPDDRGGEGQRDEAERNRRQLQRQRRLDTERPRQPVPEREWSDAERRPPRDPAELTPRCERGDLAEGPQEHNERSRTAEEQIDRLGAIEQVNRARKQRPVRRSAGHGDDTRGAQRQRRQIQERHERIRTCAGSFGSGVGSVNSWRWRTEENPPDFRALREHQREMQEERRQERHRDRIAPVEHPVEPIERPVE